jgi:hypothetical protein
MRSSSHNKTTPSGLLAAARRWSLRAVIKSSSVLAFGHPARHRAKA